MEERINTVKKNDASALCYHSISQVHRVTALGPGGYVAVLSSPLLSATACYCLLLYLPLWSATAPVE